MTCEDATHMAHALEIAARGEGLVEPNPMVGCVIVRRGVVVGEGWHERYGGPHAEIHALAAAREAAAGGTMYCTLEPCCHVGKTPPCTEALIGAGIRRAVVAQVDPFPAVAGRGLERLRAAGIQVEVGLLQTAAQELNAPYRKLLRRHMPWMIAKWAMTLDGKLATRTGHSRWISGEAARQCVHQLRGRVDGVIVGRGTAESDDPLLSARPPGKRLATRIVVDSRARLSTQSQLVKTAGQQPVLVAVSPRADEDSCNRLREAGCEVWSSAREGPDERLEDLLAELGQRRMTNVLVEGGGRLLGSLFDLDALDEFHVFVAPKLVGGQAAPSPVEGLGRPEIPDLPSLYNARIEVLGGDVYIAGRLKRSGQ